MDLGEWLVAEHDDAILRLTSHLLAVVPIQSRRTRFEGGNSIDWTLLHVARHASLALRVLGHEPEMSDSLLAGSDRSLTDPGAGLQEEEQPWLGSIDSPEVEAYTLTVLDEARAFLVRQDAASLDRVLDVPAALTSAGVDLAEYSWLARQWSSPHLLVRWVLVGHVTFHVGEMTGVRNQLGFSPFR